MSQEYKIISISAITNDGITESELTYVSTTAATINFSSVTTDNFNAQTISATTYAGLPEDIYTVSASYSAGTAEFLNSTGGTFGFSGVGIVSNVIQVALSGDVKYNSISSALSSINDASDTNRYLVKVQAGTYIEPELIVPSFVSIQGSSINTTIIVPDNSHHAFNLSELTELSFLSISGVPSGYAAIYANDFGDFTQLHKLSIYDTDYGIWVTNSTIPSKLYGEYVDITANVNAVRIDGSGVPLSVQLENFYTYSNVGFTGDVISVSGSAITLEMLAFGIIGDGGETAIKLQGDLTNTELAAQAAFIETVDTGIYVGDTGTPDLKLSSIAFESTNTVLNIQNSGTSGYYIGYAEYEKTFINQNSSFFIANKDLNVITVSDKGSDFTSIKSAVDYISDNSSSNRYVIKVSPGVYNEDVITCKPYVNIQGDSQFNTIVNSLSGNTVFIGSGNVELKGLQIGNSTLTGTTEAAIEYNGGAGTFRINEIRFANNQRHLFVGSSNGGSLVVGSALSLDATSQYLSFATIQDNGVNSADLIVNSFNYGNVIPITGNTDFFVIDGVESRLTIYNTIAGNPDVSLSNSFFHLSNGAKLISQNVNVYGFDTFCHVDNIGSAPDIKIMGSLTINCVKDFFIENQNTTGTIFGNFDRTKLDIVNGTDLAILFNDANNSGVVMTGSLYQGENWETATNITNSITYATNYGVNVTPTILTSGLSLTVLSGSGYVVLGSEPNEYIKNVSWSAQTLSLSANSFYHLYVDSDGIVSKSIGEPSEFNNILIGHVRTDATNIVYLQNDYDEGRFTANKLNYAWAEGLGNIFNTGCIVSENTTPFKIDVTSGSYWYSTHNYTPSATTAATFYQFYKDGSGGWISQSGDTVQTKYDTMSGSLATLSASTYAKHSLYVVNDSDKQKYLLVYGTEIFASQLDAENGSLPTPPSFFGGNIAPIAGLVVEGSATGLTSVRDIRPTLSFKAESTSASNVHGNLLGLDADDHTQYLLVSGTRAMSGNLNMGSNAITNATTVNGVTVESHSSRHLPNGSDPLPIGTPVAIGIALASGTSNTFAMADHIHTVDWTVVNGLSTQLNNKANLSGATFTGQVNIPTLSAATYLGLPTEVYLTAFTYDNANTFSVVNSTGGTLSASINTMTGITINGDANITGTTQFGSMIGTLVASSIGAITTLSSNSITTTGLTVNGNASVTGSVLSNTFSGRTTPAVYYGIGSNLTGIPDTYITGGTYSNGTTTFTNNTGGTFTVTGFSTSNATSFTGGTVTGATNFTNGLTANTFSATTYLGLPIDVRVTGGTYSNGTTTFTNNTGGTFNVTGLFSGFSISGSVGGNQSISSGNAIGFNTISGLSVTVGADKVVTYGLNITGTTAEPTPTTGDKLIIYDASTNTHRNIDWSQLPGSAGGEVNTASNVGGANGIFYQKSGVDLQFRSLSAGTNITITSGATTLTISSTATGSGGSSRTSGSTTTSGLVSVNLSQITGLTSDSTHFIETYVTAKSSGTTAWGTWKRSLAVTTDGSTPTIRYTNADMDAFSQNLSATTINFAVSGSNININVSGTTGTDIQWNSAYEIITRATKI